MGNKENVYIHKVNDIGIKEKVGIREVRRVPIFIRNYMQNGDLLPCHNSTQAFKKSFPKI